MARKKVVYHIFSNEVDEWEDDYNKALELYNQFKDEYGSARLYEEERDEDDDVLNEFCIKSFGGWPS